MFGIGKDGEKKPDYQPGMELHGKYVFIAEGVRGSLAKVLQAKFGLADGREPQKFGIGLKELWQVPDAVVPAGPRAAHRRLAAGGRHRRRQLHVPLRRQLRGHRLRRCTSTTRTPGSRRSTSSSASSTTRRSRRYLEGGKRIAYGARAITEGGCQSVPKLAFPGGVLIGCSAGFVNVPRIKGSHNAMKTGMLAAEAAFAAIGAGRAGDELAEYETAYDSSWVAKELKHGPQRQAAPGHASAR